jgi:hypothetical protein
MKVKVQQWREVQDTYDSGSSDAWEKDLDDERAEAEPTTAANPKDPRSVFDHW